MGKHNLDNGHSKMSHLQIKHISFIQINSHRSLSIRSLKFADYFHREEHAFVYYGLFDKSSETIKKSSRGYILATENSCRGQPKRGADHHTQPCSSEQKEGMLIVYQQ